MLVMHAAVRALFLLLVIAVTLKQESLANAANLHKRSFVSLGCMGVYDKSKFARLDRVCEECYQMFRDPDIHAMCRRNCFVNEIFDKCTEALMLSNEEPKLKSYVNQLSTGQ